ncbi:MAG: 23S rRNA pseudouridine(1911/1915/1917) synthase RluD [Gammaproteobacteria bacterium]
MSRARQLSGEVPGNLAGKRLDMALAEMFPDFSRTRLKGLIEQGQVRVNDRVPRPRDKVSGGERVSLTALFEHAVEAVAQPVPLAIVFEDDALLIVDKPAGLVVHPGAGNPDRTLQNGLLHHAPALSVLPRAGIVHRLDKDTSGLMAVAKSPAAHAELVRALEARDIHRGYEAVCAGVLTAGGEVNAPIGRHRVDRLRMAVRDRGGRPAVTHYRVIRRYRAHTHLRLELETGRTHQIRVHMAHLRHPLVGDPLYGGRMRIPPAASDDLIETLRNFRRQALHAARLAFAHPVSGKALEFRSPLPGDLQALLAALEADAEAAAD